MLVWEDVCYELGPTETCGGGSAIQRGTANCGIMKARTIMEALLHARVLTHTTERKISAWINNVSIKV